jgi:predicted ester cyclase
MTCISGVQAARQVRHVEAGSRSKAASTAWSTRSKAGFLGLRVEGRRIAFAENVFYEFDDDRKIRAVWSIIDKAAIERQLA